MTKIAHLGVAQRGIECSLNVVWILLLYLYEILRCVLPFSVEHVEASQLKSCLWVDGSAESISVITQRIFQIVYSSWITLA